MPRCSLNDLLEAHKDRLQQAVRHDPRLRRRHPAATGLVLDAREGDPDPDPDPDPETPGVRDSLAAVGMILLMVLVIAAATFVTSLVTLWRS